MNTAEQLRKKIESTISRSGVAEDPVHSKNTLKWLLKLKPDADEALQIAALGHDIERAVEQRKVRREDFPDYDRFKAAHATNSAEILKEIMLECGVEDETLIQEVYDLVWRHEVGGDPRCDLLKDADGISFFEVNLPFYYQRNGPEETKRRCRWGYRRLSEKAKKIAANLTFENEQLNGLLRITIEEGRRTLPLRSG
jgi:hypothetical protein